MACREFESGSIVGQRYRIDRVIGHGPRGAVYSALDVLNGGIKVALKILELKRDPQRGSASLCNDLSSIGCLRHSCLSSVLDFGAVEIAHSAFIVREYVDGCDILNSTTDWQVSRILKAVAHVCKALQHLHNHGFIHGNLGPSNILLPFGQEDRESPKLVDFALARMGLTTIGPPSPGSLAYASPEVLLGQPFTQRSDLYSLGVLLYQLLTRALPFEDDNQGYLIQKHLQGRIDVRPIEMLDHGAGLAQVVLSLLEKEPEKRPTTAEDVIRSLSAASGQDYASRAWVLTESYFSSSRFVGREKDMARLQDLLAQVKETGRGRTLFLVGEGGVGKSRCMQELRIWALLEGWRVVEAGCSPSENRSYSPYRQILEWAARLDQFRPGGTAEKPIFQFETSVRKEEAPAFEFSSETAAGQFRDQLTRELVRRLSGQATLLLLHDFHHADEATTAVLDYLSSDVSIHPILICVSLRPVEDDNGPLGRLMEQSVRQLRADKHVLEPLSPTCIAELIESMTGDSALGGALGPSLSRVSGGNPFFVEEILKHLVDRGLLQKQVETWHLSQGALEDLEAPGSITAILRQRIDRLSANAREIADWLSVFGRPVTVDLLKTAVRGNPGEFEAGWKELQLRQIIRILPVQGQDCAEFSHAIVSEVLYDSMTDHRQRRMHAKIGAVLDEDQDAEQHLQEIASHYTRAGHGEKAVEYAFRAAKAARAEFANKTALQFYEYILKNKTHLPVEKLCEAAMEAADAYCTLGTPKRAIHLIKQQLRKQIVALNPIIKAQLLMQLSRSYQFLGNRYLSEKAAHQGIGCLKGIPDNQHIATIESTLLAQIAFGMLAKSDAGNGLEIAHAAIDKVRGLPISPHVGHLYILISGLCFVSCKFREGLRASKKAIEILESLNSVPLLPIAYSHSGLNLAGLGQLRLASQQHAHAVMLATQTRSLFFQAQSMCNLAECYQRSGLFKAAIEVSDQMLKISGFIDNPNIQISGLLSKIETLVSMGLYGEASALLKTIGTREDSLPVYSKAQALFLKAWFAAEIEDWQDCSTSLKKLAHLVTKKDVYYETGLESILRARLVLSKKDTASAVRILESMIEQAKRAGMLHQLCTAWIWLARAYLSAGDFEAAHKIASKSIQLSKRMGGKALEAEARLIDGISLCNFLNCKQGNSFEDCLKSARSELKTALSIASEIESHEIIWRAHYELADLEDTMKISQESSFHAQAALNELSFLESELQSRQQNGVSQLSDRKTAMKRCESLIREAKANSDPLFLTSDEMDNENLKWLFQASCKLNSIRSLEELPDLILSLIIQQTKFERGILCLNYEKDKVVSLMKEKSQGVEVLDTAPGIRNRIVQIVYNTSEPFITANAPDDPRLHGPDSIGADTMGTILCSPLRSNSKLLGVLYAAHHKPAGVLNESTINFFAAFCNLVAIAIDNAMAHAMLVEEKETLERHLQLAKEGYPEILGDSDAVRTLREVIARAAVSPLDTLIWGESGTGKELIARALHRTGRRASGQFMPVDCGSLSDTLAESELFGFRKGAFTGAMDSRAGLLEAADGGTIFLDEISNLSLQLQAKLLRVLQEREVRRIGETHARKIDIRVIAATNKNPREEVRQGRFREDLFFRLTQMEIRAPSLRERREDIPLLIDCFLSQAAGMEGGRTKLFSPAAAKLLCRYSYPGNVRELLNFVMRAYYSAKGRIIEVEHLPIEVLPHMNLLDPQPEGDGSQRKNYDQGKIIYDQIKEGNGTFYDLVKTPFLERHLGSGTVRCVIKCALTETQGRYREAFRILKVPDRDYSKLMIFLKRHGCYLDFRPYRDQEE